MRTHSLIAASVLLALASAPTGAAARARVVHVSADTVVIHPRSDDPRARAMRVVSLPAEGIVVHGDVLRLPKAPRPTRAALIACRMGPHFLGEAWRGKRYRPFTRSGRPRICLTG